MSKTSFDESLLEILACPASRDPLRLAAAPDAQGAQELVCTGQACGLAFPITDGIPVLLVDSARRTR